MSALSNSVVDVINSYLSEPHASILNGITWGAPLRKSLQVYDYFKRAGLLHLVVASGSNIAILSGTILFFFQRFGKYVSLLILLLTNMIYVYIVGLQAPIIRASIMSIFSFVSLMFGRRTISIYVLFVTTIIMALISLKMVLSVSFYLSFSATLGIILLGGSGDNKNNSLLSEIIGELRPSLSASFFTAPIIWIYFKQISFIAPISNILVGFMVAPVMLFGILLTLLGLIFHPLGYLLRPFIYGMVEYIILIAKLTSKVPYSFISF